MKCQRLLLLVLCSAFLLIPAARSHAQHITRVNPDHITLRAASLASLWTGMVVGDSGYVAVTHSALAGDLADVWERRQTGFDHSITLHAVAYAGDTLHAVIAGSNGSLAWTNDGGTSWHPVSLGITATIRALTWNTSTLENILVGVGDGGLVIRSSDMGQTWKTSSSHTSAQLNAIAFGTTSEAVAAGNDTTIIQSHDGGLTWSPLVYPYHFHTMERASWYDTIIKRIDFTGVAMGGADTVWVVMERPIGPLPIYRGAAIVDSPGVVVATTGDPTPAAFTSLIYTGMPNFMQLIGFTASDYMLYDTGWKSKRGGDYWIGRNLNLIGDADGGIDPVPLRLNGAAVWKMDTTLQVLMVGEELTAMRYIWSPRATGHSAALSFFDDPSLIPGKSTVIDFIDASILPNGYGYAVAPYTYLQRTTDSGRTWATVPVPIYHNSVLNNGTYDSSFNTVLTVDTSSAIVIGWDGLIYAFGPSGGHFVPSGTQERLHGIVFPSVDTGIIVGDFGTVLQSVDRGASWLPINISSPAFLYSVAFANSQIGVATGDNGTILRTTDRGTTWSDINNILSGQVTTIRQVQAFANGTFLARADGSLIRSSDFGVTWQYVALPVADSDGMSFYSPKIGIVAERMTTSASVPDTAYLAFTINGGATWKEFIVPIWATNRILFHWLSDHEVMLYGTDGFIVDVDLSIGDVQIVRTDRTRDFQLFPNPSSGELRVKYTTKTSGLVTIELVSEAGEKVKGLFSGQETAGEHARSFSLPDLHGSFFVRLLGSDGTQSVSELQLR